MKKTCSLSMLLMAMLMVVLCPQAQCATLTINNNTVAADIRTIGGHAYVSLADVAKALGMTLIKTANGYQIAPAGGAGQDNGKMQGKVGDMLFDGKWRFQVVSWTKADTYSTQYSDQPGTVTPKSPNDTLIIVNCVLKNGQKQSDQPILSMIHPQNTAVVDDQGQSYPVVGLDRRGANLDEAAAMLPGASANVVAVFEVPKSANIKAMVFTLWDLNTFATGGDDVRVSLAP